MAAPSILYLDTTNKRLIASFLSTINPLTSLIWEAGDLVPIQLHFLQSNNSSGTTGQLPYSYIDPSTVLPVSLALGIIDQPPTAGTFTVTYGANTTAAQPFNQTAALLSTALNALASVTSAGGVVITGNAGGPYRITFNTAGVIATLFSVNAAGLAPTSQGIVARAVTGAAGVQENQVITLVQNPAALLASWTATYGAITVTQLQTGGAGLNSIQRVTIPQGTYAGAYSLSFGTGAVTSTTSIPYNATATQVQTALQALTGIGTGNVQVIQSSPVTWDITFIGTLGGLSQVAIVGNAVGLQMPQYLAGSLQLNVQGIFDLLGTATSAAPVLQIQQGSPGSVNTVLQTTITLNNTLIVGTPGAPVIPPANGAYTTTYASGSKSVAVAFPGTLSFTPSGVLCNPMGNGPTAPIMGGQVDYASITTTGFNYVFNSVPSVAGKFVVIYVQ